MFFVNGQCTEIDRPFCFAVFLIEWEPLGMVHCVCIHGLDVILRKKAGMEYKLKMIKKLKMNENFKLGEQFVLQSDG